MSDRSQRREQSRSEPEVADSVDLKRDIEELDRLMQGFSGELRKLEEGLKTLAAFLERMRKRTTPSGTDSIH